MAYGIVNVGQPEQETCALPISDSRSSRLYRLDRTGDRTVDRCGDKPARLCNLLSFLHGVAYSHNRNRRRSDVL